MDLFLAVLYIHVIATLGLVAAMGAEAFALTELRRTLVARDSTYSHDPFPATRAVASICLIVLFFSGGYLTDHVGLWRTAWPKIAIGIIVAFGALAGISGRKLTKIRRVFAEDELPNVDTVRQLQVPFLRMSLAIRTGLVVAAVWLMTAKPDFLASLESSWRSRPSPGRGPLSSSQVRRRDRSQPQVGKCAKPLKRIPARTSQ